MTFYIKFTSLRIQMKDHSKMNLEAINILKGLAYSQLQLEDQRAKLIQTGYFNVEDVYNQIDRRLNGHIQPQDIINFLGVHRIASNQRQCQYLIWMAGSNEPNLIKEQFVFYLTNGHPDYIQNMQSSGVGSRLLPADEVLRNSSERQVAKLFQKQIEYYRSIEQLREQFVKQNGFQFNTVISQIDKDHRGTVALTTLVNFIQQFGVQFSKDEFEAVGRKIRSRDTQSLSYKQLMRAFSPFEPLNFPTYRKKSNMQKAMDYINDKVKLLQIDTYNAVEEDIPRKTKTGFQKVLEDFRNPATQGAHLSSKFFYDKNYYNELRQYKTTFYDPNKDVKRKIQTQMVGPQYHDHFFSDYYLHLQERNKTEHYYNKFGKRYTYDNPIAQTLDSKR